MNLPRFENIPSFRYMGIFEIYLVLWNDYIFSNLYAFEYAFNYGVLILQK